MAIRVGSRRALLGNVSAAADNNPGTTNLISWWSLDETSGTRNDSHGSNHLTDNNTVTSAAGKQSNAADFESTNSEYLSIADNASISTGDIDFTFACWFKPESSAQAALFSKWETTGSQKEYLLVRAGADDKLYWHVSSGSSASAGAISDALTNGQWYFVVVWHDSVANQSRMQINNGTVISDAWSGGVLNSSTEFNMGRHTDNSSNFWDGLIDEVAFYKRVLTADERAWLWNGGAGRAYSELS